MGIGIGICLVVVAMIAIVMTLKTDKPAKKVEIEESNKEIVNESEKVESNESQMADEDSQIYRLTRKANQVETFRITMCVLIIISCIIYIFAAVDCLPDGISTAISISFIITAALSIYTVNIWSTTKQELCKGQAEILKKMRMK